MLYHEHVYQESTWWLLVINSLELYLHSYHPLNAHFVMQSNYNFCHGFLWLIFAFIVVCGCADGNAQLGNSAEKEQESFVFADPDLQISLVASEPDVVSPVDMAWAPDGSLFVVEIPGYPITENTGRIKKLTDPDGDGLYHLAAVFAEGLNYPNSIMWYRGGILVTDAPDIIFLRDTNGDGEADKQQKIISGFEPGNEQLRANGLYWGYDNWIYGANGRSGGSVHFMNNNQKVSVDNRDFRFRPQDEAIEAISGMSQYGLAQDNWGNRFISYNHRFARQVVLEERYLNRNPALSVHTIHDTGQSEHDRRVYTLFEDAMRFNRDPIGYFTSLSGLTVFRGDQLGEAYDGDLFAGESVQAAVIHRRMQKDGPIFTALNTHAETEFLASPDGWFHPVNFSNGPDGALYMVDFYRLLVEHPEWAHDDKKDGVDWKLGEENGRIWRIFHKDSQQNPGRMLPGLEQMDAEELVEQLTEPGGWRRDMAQQLLVDGNKQEAGPALVKLLDHEYPLASMHALWTLEGLNLLDEEHILKALNSQSDQLKVHAIRLAETRIPESEELMKSVAALAISPNQEIRFYAILALGGIDTPMLQKTLISTTKAYHDQWSRIALLSSIAGWSHTFSDEILSAAFTSEALTTEDLLFFRQIGAVVAADTDNTNDSWIDGMVNKKTLNAQKIAFVAGYLKTLRDTNTSIPDLSEAFFNHCLRLARQQQDPLLAATACELVGYSNSLPTQKQLVDLIFESQESEVQTASIKTISSLNQPELSAALYDNLEALSPLVRKEVILSSLGSVAAAGSLLDAINADKIGSTEISEELRHALLAHSDPSVSAQAKEILGKAVDSDRQAVVDRYLASLGGQTVDLKGGQVIFEQHCTVCHAIGGKGGLLGPDLTNIGSRSDDVLMVSILDPSRMVSYELKLHVVLTKSGEIYSGTISSETASSITVRQPDGQEHTILKENIAENNGTDQSIMPEGFERMIDEKGMADLIGYLRQPL